MSGKSRAIAGIALLTLLVGCAPHFYDGVAAVLNESSGFMVTKKEHSWGDCYSKVTKIPTVYQLNEDNYSITITQGPRYWPEFFLEARTSEGDELEIEGTYVEKIQVRWGGDMRRLREARGTRPTHKTVELTNVPGRQFQVEILDDSGTRIGQHRLSFELQDVKCMEIDGV